MDSERETLATRFGLLYEQSGSLEFLISQGGFDFILGGFALEGTYGHVNEFQRWKGTKISGFDQPRRVFLA